ncbi:MAG: hypothetical protein ABI724_03965 [Betaproteobacteria bacterium]
MKSRKQYLTEPEDRRWLEVTPRTAVAGGLIVVILLAAMVALAPGERPAVAADSAVRPSMADTQRSNTPRLAPEVSTANPQPATTGPDEIAAPDNHPPTF